MYFDYGRKPDHLEEFDRMAYFFDWIHWSHDQAFHTPTLSLKTTLMAAMLKVVSKLNNLASDYLIVN